MGRIYDALEKRFHSSDDEYGCRFAIVYGALVIGAPILFLMYLVLRIEGGC